MSEKLKNLEKAVSRLQNNQFNFIFLVPDTNGVARASVAITYHHALTLHNRGINVIILHEKNDYMKVGSWLGEEYDALKHISIESNKLEVSASDFLVIPEVYGNIVEQTSHLPCRRIVFVQSLEYMLDTYSPGKSWLDYNVIDTIATSPEAKQAIEDLLYVTNVKVVPIGVPDIFKPYAKLKKPVVAIHCKEPRKTAKILKMFYLKYPYLRWITFRDMHGMTYADYARNLSECILSVWVDHNSTFPMFLLESVKSNVPVIAQLPTLLLDWMTDDYATWTMTDHQTIELTAAYIKSWLEDHIPPELMNVSRLTEGKFTRTEMEDAIEKTYKEYVDEHITAINAMIEKAKQEDIQNKIETPQTNEEQN